MLNQCALDTKMRHELCSRGELMMSICSGLQAQRNEILSGQAKSFRR